MKKLSQETKAKIQDLTNCNDHVGARILLSKELGFTYFAGLFNEYQNSYENIEELSKTLFAVVFQEDPSLHCLF